MSISEYWEMTPNEFNLYVEAHNEKLQHEQEERLTLVWLGAYCQRVEKLMSLNEFLGKEDQGMSDDQMLEQVRMLNVKFGGETIVKDGE